MDTDKTPLERATAREYTLAELMDEARAWNTDDQRLLRGGEWLGPDCAMLRARAKVLRAAERKAVAMSAALDKAIEAMNTGLSEIEAEIEMDSEGPSAPTLLIAAARELRSALKSAERAQGVR